MRAKEGNTWAWLTVMPLARSGNVLSATEFRDGLALRYALHFSVCQNRVTGAVHVWTYNTRWAA